MRQKIVFVHKNSAKRNGHLANARRLLMSTLNFRNENEWCDLCNEEPSECCCYVIFPFEGDEILEGYEIIGLETIMLWGADLAFNGSPPRDDGPVLNVLPIQVARVLGELFLEITLFGDGGCECGEDLLISYGGDWKISRVDIYSALLEVADECHETKTVRTDGIIGGIWDNIEVENPDATRNRMEAIAKLAVDAIEALETVKNEGTQTN